MQYWAVIDNERKGPMSLEELISFPISPETLVWREGLVEWIQAKDLSELSQYFANHIEPPTIPVAVPEQKEEVEEVVAEVVSQPIQPVVENQPEHNASNAEPASSGASSWYPNADQNRLCPPTYLVFAIITLACCCQPFGIVALVYSTQVTSLYNMGQYEKASRYSNNALIWSIVALVSGLIFVPLMILTNLFEAFGSFPWQ